MNDKQYVTDADTAATIEQECCTGDAERDRWRAGEILCQVLGSRDYDKTVAAFKAVVNRAEGDAAITTDPDELTAEIERLVSELSRADRWGFIRYKIAAALSAARGDERASLLTGEQLHDGIVLGQLQERERWEAAAREVIEIFSPEEHDCTCTLAALLTPPPEVKI